MQVKKSIFLNLPEAYVHAIDRFFIDTPHKHCNTKEYYYFIIHSIAVKQMQRKKKEFVSIDLQKFKSLTVSNIDRYIKYLIDGELLERDSFVQGKKAYSYKLKDKYLIGVSNYQVKPDTRLFARLISEQRNNRKHNNRLDPHLKQMKDLLYNIDVDYLNAKKWANTLPEGAKKQYAFTSIAMLEDKRLRYFKRNKTNFRLDTNLTSINSELRQFIKGDYVSIDLKNSQPFLLSQLLKTISYSTINSVPLCYYFTYNNIVQWFGKKQVNEVLKVPQNNGYSNNGELLNFENVCLKGVFYDEFLTQSNVDDLDRDKVKDMMFAIMFSANILYRNFKRFVPYKDKKQLFRDVYPSLMQMIEALKEKEHNKLAIYLQRIESYIFIDTISRKLVESGIIPLTIHDSVIVPAKQQQQTLEIIKQVFSEQVGTIPTFHVKPLKH